MFEKITVNIVYRVNNKKRTVNLKDGGNSDIGFAITKEANRLKIDLLTDGTITIDEAFLTTDYYYVPHYNVYCGALSYGFSMEKSVSTSNKMKFFKYINSSTPVKIKLKNLKSYGYTYVRDRENYTLVGSLEEESSFTEINHRPELRKMTFKRTFDGLQIGEEYRVFDLYFDQGSYDSVFDGYFSTMFKDYKPKKILKEYDACDEGDFHLNSKSLHEKLTYARDFPSKFDVFCLESYAKHTGEWLHADGERFTEKLDDIANFIKNVNMEAGIRLAPFAVSPKSELAQINKYLFEKDDFGMIIKKKGVFHYDIDNEEAKEYIKNMFTKLKKYGFTVFKVEGIGDLLYTKNSSVKAFKIMHFLRECVGEDCTLITLDAPVMVAAGIADYCRVTGNVVRRWKGTYSSRIFNRRHSARNLVLNAISRRHLDGRVFRNYTTKLYFDETKTRLTEQQKIILFLVNKFFEGSVIVSDDLRQYTDKIIDMFSSISEGTSKERIIRVVFPLKNHIRIEYLDDDNNKRMICFNLKQGEILYTL